MLGGELTVDSKVGEGSTFSFGVTAKILHPRELMHLSSSARPGQRITLEESIDGSQYRMLVVEDVAASRKLLFTFLTSLGFDVREANDGQQGLEMWEAWKPHLIWMDMRMPVLDGFQATEMIRNSPGGKDVTIVALTAHAFED